MYVYYTYVFFIIYSNRKDCKNTECFYIDVFNHGNILTKKNCPKIGQAETCPMKDLSILDKIIPAEVGNYPLYFYV